eukprot:GHRR01007305.1.p1 GENE.GHRR01007305.1~~GHRR01007305.1.p1  ORF type:complete len:191 (+),score=32.72 GHRR01007305.1:3374-3946(+)
MAARYAVDLSCCSVEGVHLSVPTPPNLLLAAYLSLNCTLQPAMAWLRYTNVPAYACRQEAEYCTLCSSLPGNYRSSRPACVWRLNDPASFLTLPPQRHMWWIAGARLNIAHCALHCPKVLNPDSPAIVWADEQAPTELKYVSWAQLQQRSMHVAACVAAQYQPGKPMIYVSTQLVLKCSHLTTLCNPAIN